MSNKPLFHGSDLELVEKYYGIPKAKIVSFSANVNPLGISPKFRESMLLNIDSVISYPDRDYKELRTSISNYCGAPFDMIMPGSGATELISRFIRTTAPTKVMLVNPTYSEYEREIRINGGKLTSWQLNEEDDFRLSVEKLCDALDSSFELLIMCNPNNPTGFALHHAGLTELLSHCQRNSIRVLIDETYVEFTEDMEDITAVPLAAKFSSLIVLRGISKFFAAPGLRLGYAVSSDKELRRRVGDTEDPWAINSIAAVSGGAMFSDTEYIMKTKKFAADERSRLLDILKAEPNLHVYEPSANFILMKILKKGITSEMVFEHAVKKGLMLRDCSSFPGLHEDHIRFCLCAPEQNDRLIAAILEILH